MLRVVNAQRVAIAAVIGRNCRAIRDGAGVTRNELAKYARAAGLNWTASKVGDFESGRNAPTFATVLAATVALSNATHQNVLLADLLTFDDGYVVVTDRIVPRGPKVAAAARGEPLVLDDDDTFESVLVEVTGQIAQQCRDAAEVRARSGVDEYRLARRLGINADRLAAVSFRLWSRPFSVQRDRLAGTDANQQQRGQISRKLQAELKEALADGDN
jgi:transcriptional regulator with XRE-family HTH domain